MIQFTVQRFDWVHKHPGLTEESEMPESCSPGARKTRSRSGLTTAFLIYGAIVAGLLGFFVVFPDTSNRGTQGEGAPIQTAAKAVRYQAVIANWHRYRNKDARAEAR